MAFGELTLMTFIVGVGIGPTAPAKAKSAGAAEIGAALDAGTRSARAAMPGAAWTMAKAAAAEEPPTLKDSKFLKE